MSKKIRRKSKKPGGQRTSAVQRMVRLRRDEALELQSMCHGSGLEAAKEHLRFLKPHLEEEAVHEVAWRCEDPRARGGIKTGIDDAGEYADIVVT